MSRLPQPGKDNGTWGDILNDYLSQVHNADGTLKDNTVGGSQLQPNSVNASVLANSSVDAAAIQDGTVLEAKLSTAVQTKLNQTAPVTKVNNQTGDVVLSKSDVGLANVDNTADTAKPVSTAQQTALDAKANTSANLSDLANASTARTNLGLGTAATLNTGTTAGTVAAGDDARLVAVSKKVEVVTYSGSLSTTRPIADAVYWVDYPSTPTNAQSQDIVATAVGTALLAASNLSDLTNASTARTNLGLGTAATENTGTTSGTLPLLSTGGVLPIARLATGTPDGTKFVRDDGTLATPAGGGGGTTSYPHHVNVPGLVQPSSSSVTPILAYQPSVWYNVTLSAGVSVNNYLEWEVLLAAGTYTLRILWLRGTNEGIVTISIDGTDLGTTIDMYGTYLANQVAEMASIVLTAGNHAVRFRVTSKNASSSNYSQVFHGFSLTRTGP